MFALRFLKNLQALSCLFDPCKQANSSSCVCENKPYLSTYFNYRQFYYICAGKLISVLSKTYFQLNIFLNRHDSASLFHTINSILILKDESLNELTIQGKKLPSQYV